MVSGEGMICKLYEIRKLRSCIWRFVQKQNQETWWTYENRDFYWDWKCGKWHKKAGGANVYHHHKHEQDWRRQIMDH